MGSTTSSQSSSVEPKHPEWLIAKVALYSSPGDSKERAGKNIQAQRVVGGLKLRDFESGSKLVREKN